MDSSKQNPIETGGHKLLPFTVLVYLSSTAIFVLQSTCILFDVIEDFRLLFHSFFIQAQLFDYNKTTILRLCCDKRGCKCVESD